jgi:uncharacterized membrane protein (UPF0127 family)
MISNLSKKSVLSEKEEVKNGFEKTIGLIGKDKEKTILFNTRFGIHTFFLKFPIAVIVLSDDNKVMYLKKKILPNRIFIWNIKYKKVIELPCGKIEKSNTEIGDILEFKL